MILLASFPDIFSRTVFGAILFCFIVELLIEFVQEVANKGIRKQKNAEIKSYCPIVRKINDDIIVELKIKIMKKDKAAKGNSLSADAKFTINANEGMEVRTLSFQPICIK